MGTRFVVHIDNAMTQRAQDNKFIESGLENWVLVNLDYRHHKFKDSLYENTETNGKRSSIREAFFLYQAVFFNVIVDKLPLPLPYDFSDPLYIKDPLHYIALF